VRGEHGDEDADGDGEEGERFLASEGFLAGSWSGKKMASIGCSKSFDIVKAKGRLGS
jgi:hypothetical protein